MNMDIKIVILEQGYHKQAYSKRDIMNMDIRTGILKYGYHDRDIRTFGKTKLSNKFEFI